MDGRRGRAARALTAPRCRGAGAARVQFFEVLWTLSRESVKPLPVTWLQQEIPDSEEVQA